MGCLSRDQILGAADLPREQVATPEWGKDSFVFVRALSASERDQFEATNIKVEGEQRKVDLTNLRAKLCVRTIVDEAGGRIFLDTEAGALGLKSAAAVDRLFDVSRRLSGMDSEAMKALEKNSGTGPGAGSPSA